MMFQRNTQAAHAAWPNDEPAVPRWEGAVRERHEPAPDERRRQKGGESTVVQHASGEGHGADAAAPGRGKGQFRQPLREALMELPGQRGNGNARLPSFQQVQKKGYRVKLQQTFPFQQGKRKAFRYRTVLYMLQTNGCLPFVGDDRAEAEQGGHGVEEAAAA